MPHINREIVQLLLNEFNVKNALDCNRDVVIVWDEMKIRSGLVVSQGSGELIGFTQLDKISEGIYTLQSSSQSNDGDTSELATHIMVFMVRGLLNSVSLPFIWYPCTGFSADQLWGAVWTTTKTREDCSRTKALRFVPGHVMEPPATALFQLHMGSTHLNYVYKIDIVMLAISISIVIPTSAKNDTKQPGELAWKYMFKDFA